MQVTGRTERGVALAVATVLAGGLLAVPALRAPEPRAPRQAVAAAVEVDAELPVHDAMPGAAPADDAVPLVEETMPSVPAARDEPATVPPPVPPRPLRKPAPALEERAYAALGGLDYPWQELGYDIRFQAYDDGGLIGLTDPHARTITVFVREQQSDHSLRVTIAHEIAHALDFETGNDAQRRGYLERRDLAASTPWFPCARCSDYASGAGDWAEVFAYWLAGPGDFRSELAGPPSGETLEQLVPLFAPPSQRQRAVAAEPSPSPSPSPTRRPLIPDLP